MRVILSLFIYILLVSSIVYGDTKNDEVNNNQDGCGAVVFIYHRFGDDRYPSTNIQLKQFEKHLQYIQDNHFKVWPLSKIVNYLLQKKKIPQKVVALSIDDAYITTYTNAYPRLKEKKFPFTVFVSTQAVDTKSNNYMSWEQMREMRLHGAEFANHSLTHHYLHRKKSETKKDWEIRFKHEINGAQKQLQKNLGISTNTHPKLFSYPFGEYNQEMVDILKKLEYMSVTQVSGVINENSNLNLLPRFAMSQTFAQSFTLKINTLALPVKSVYPTQPLVTSKKPPILKIKLKKAIKNIHCYRANGKQININWLSNKELEVQAKEPLNKPRDRYTCTARAENKNWYWFSHLWIVR